MTKRDFNKHLNACRNKKHTAIDKTKIVALPEETRKAMLEYIVRQRGPVLVEMITPLVDMHWLAACGYLYKTAGKASGNTFVHTCEHTIR